MQFEYQRWESARYMSPLFLQGRKSFRCFHTVFPNVWFQFHAEVYFDQEQQSYMLVDQGSQNGTVINGNRILQVSEFRKRQNVQLSCDFLSEISIHSPKPSRSLRLSCTEMKLRWGRRCCPSTSTQALIPVMVVNPDK